VQWFYSTDKSYYDVDKGATASNNVIYLADVVSSAVYTDAVRIDVDKRNFDGTLNDSFSVEFGDNSAPLYFNFSDLHFPHNMSWFVQANNASNFLNDVYFYCFDSDDDRNGSWYTRKMGFRRLYYTRRVDLGFKRAVLWFNHDTMISRINPVDLPNSTTNYLNLCFTKLPPNEFSESEIPSNAYTYAELEAYWGEGNVGFYDPTISFVLHPFFDDGNNEFINIGVATARNGAIYVLGYYVGSPTRFYKLNTDNAEWTLDYIAGTTQTVGQTSTFNGLAMYDGCVLTRDTAGLDTYEFDGTNFTWRGALGGAFDIFGEAGFAVSFGYFLVPTGSGPYMIG